MKILAINRWFPFNITKKFTGLLLRFVVVSQKTSNLYPIFLLIAAFYKCYCHIQCCFHVLVVKLIWKIFNEMKQQRQRPIVSTKLDSCTSISQELYTFAQKFDSVKVQNVSNFCFEERAAKKPQIFLIFKEPRYFVMGTSIDLNLDVRTCI